MTTEVRTKQRSDARDNRAIILAVARRAFAAEGIEVPMREIARRAELGVATLYRHFPTKDALLAEAFADQFASCSQIVEDGLAENDAWNGFCRVIERLMVVHALDRGFARAFTSQLPEAQDASEGRAHTIRLLAELAARARLTGSLRDDFVVEDLVVALMANEGIRAESPELRVVVSRRFAALTMRSFRASEDAAPLPPAVRLPLLGY